MPSHTTNRWTERELVNCLGHAPCANLPEKGGCAPVTSTGEYNNSPFKEEGCAPVTTTGEWKTNNLQVACAPVLVHGGLTTHWLSLQSAGDALSTDCVASTTVLLNIATRGGKQNELRVRCPPIYKVYPDICACYLAARGQVCGSLTTCPHNRHAIVKMTLTLYLRHEVILHHAPLWDVHSFINCINALCHECLYK